MHDYIIVSIVTFIIFIIEATFHYNIGKHNGKKYDIPNNGEFQKIIMVTLVFSIINGIVSSFVVHAIND